MRKTIKKYVEYIADDSETADYKSLMSQAFLPENSGRVGIFWYSPARNELFGVVKANPYDLDDKNLSSARLPNSDVVAYTCRVLHEQVWKKEYNWHKFHDDGSINLFVGDYKDKPRGRIFYEPQQKLFKVCVGDWIKQNREAIDIIVDEFGLLDSDFDFVISNHWDIGMGWENR